MWRDRPSLAPYSSNMGGHRPTPSGRWLSRSRGTSCASENRPPNVRVQCSDFDDRAAGSDVGEETDSGGPEPIRWDRVGAVRKMGRPNLSAVSPVHGRCSESPGLKTLWAICPRRPEGRPVQDKPRQTAHFGALSPEAGFKVVVCVRGPDPVDGHVGRVLHRRNGDGVTTPLARGSAESPRRSASA